MFRAETRKDIRTFILVSIVFLILLFSLFSAFQIPVKAIGGGGGFAWQAGTALQSTSVTTNATTNARVISAAGLQEEVKGAFIIAHITSFSPHTVVSSIADTASDSYSKLIRSCKFECVELWVANYTGTNFAANTITVTFNASTASITVYKIAFGVLNTNYQTSDGNGTGSTLTVSSFTPNTNGFCTGMASVDTGNTGAASYTTPNFWDNTITSNSGATVFHTGTVESVDNWQSSYGATTISTTVSPVTGTAQWDFVAMCFQGGTATSTTTTSTTTSSTTSTTTTTATTTTTTSTSTAYEYVERQNATNSSTFTAANNNMFQISKIPVLQNNLLILSLRMVGHLVTNTTFPNSITDNASDVWLLKVQNSFANGFGVQTWIANATGTGSKVLNIKTGLFHSGASGIRVTTYFHEFNLQDPYFVKAQNITTTGNNIKVPSITTKYSNFIYSFASGFNNSAASQVHFTTIPKVISFNLTQSYLNWTLASADQYFYGNQTSTYQYIVNSTNAHLAENLLEFQLLATTTSTSSSTTTSTTTTTTISTTPTTTTTTSTTTTTLTSPTVTGTTTVNSTSLTITTGTVIPEPAGSTDFLLILLGLMVFLILMGIGLIRRNPFPTLLGAIVLLIMNVGLYTNNKIINGQNIITTPLWVNQTLTILVVFGFVLVVYQLYKRR